MAEDDLDAPLGLDRDQPRASSREIPWRGLAFTGIGMVAASLVAFIFISDDGSGGEPFATAPIKPAPPPPAVAADHNVVVPPNAAAGGATVDKTPTASIAAGGGDVVTENGVKVVRPGGRGAPGVRIIDIPDSTEVHLAPAPDRRLVEKSSYGFLPKIGADGMKPLDAYARPLAANSALAGGAPRIALFVGGMGLSQSATRAALDKLPGAVTLGFAPYGADLDAQVARARGEGHEIVLQMPMESFDDTQPLAPHTLAASIPAAQNRDNLHWLMSRFSGYAGTANFLGAKFTGDQSAFGPVLQEIGARGLYYLDDGTSPRSLALSLAGEEGTPVLGTDLVLDAGSSGPDAIAAMLEKLVPIAEKKGAAIGVATGLPASVDAIGRFARSLEGRGIELVPLSALVKDPAPAPAVAGRP